MRAHPTKQLDPEIVRRTIHGLWVVRKAPPIGAKQPDPPDPIALKKPALLELAQPLARRLHMRWARAERAILDDDQSMAAVTTALLLVSRAYMLTVLEHLPPDQAQIGVDMIREDLEKVLSSRRGMSDELYNSGRVYEGFWRVREPPLADRRLPDYRANIDGNIDGPEGERS